MPKRLIIVIVAASVAALAAIPAQSVAGGTLTSCGSGVRAKVIPCDKAKRIAKEYAKTRKRAIQGFTCTSRRKGDVIKGRCALNEKLVLFSFRP